MIGLKIEIFKINPIFSNCNTIQMSVNIMTFVLILWFFFICIPIHIYILYTIIKVP